MRPTVGNHQTREGSKDLGCRDRQRPPLPRHVELLKPLLHAFAHHCCIHRLRAEKIFGQSARELEERNAGI
eukprot:1090789-Lingulodinium_polyedra.AAC.1